jgi:hypothetical protein
MESWHPSRADVGIFLDMAARGLNQIHGIIAPDGEAAHTDKMHVILYGRDHRPAHQAGIRGMDRAVTSSKGEIDSLFLC